MSIDRLLPAKFGMTRENGKEIGELIETASADFQRGFLRALFDCDGHVEGWRESDDHKGVSVRLAQSDLPALQAVQRMLLRLGVKSRIYKARDAGPRNLPDGKGGIKEYPCKTAYRLVVGSDDVQYFSDQIGFAHTAKSERLLKAIAARKFYHKPFIATVEALTLRGAEPVYDITVEGRNAFDANGFVVHNCEQPLESKELCTLVETFISRHESLEDFKATLKVAYLYAKTVTLLPTHWEETNAIMQRNRRIGTSVSGVAEFADRQSMNVLKTWLNEGYATVRQYDKTYSEWLCVRESIRVTTVKPSGTVSQLAGTTPGVHWAPGGQHFLRALRISTRSPLVPLLEAAGYTVEPEKYDPEGTVVAYFPIKSGSTRAEGEVTLWEKANLAVVAQRYWSDNSVSVTVSFDPETEADKIGHLLHMFEGQLKTISFLPKGDRVYDQQPYTEITSEGYESYISRLKKIDMGVLYLAENAVEAVGEQFCTTDTCLLPVGV